MLESYAQVNDAELARAVQMMHANTDAAIVTPTETPSAAHTPRTGSGAK
jgi:hypothetical protein